jgi:hypothetical protein
MNEYKQSVVVIWQSPPADTRLSTENQLAYLTRVGRSAGQERLRLDLLRLRVGDHDASQIRPAPTPGIRSISTGRLCAAQSPLASRHQESARRAARTVVILPAANTLSTLPAAPENLVSCGVAQGSNPAGPPYLNKRSI